MKAVILAGGKGTRLGLLDIPKPMVPINGKPLLEIQIELLKKYGIDEIYLLEGYLAEKIKLYFGDGSAFGVKLHHIVEEKPLGTAGAIKQIENLLHERFLVFYGDIILDFDLESFQNFDERYNDIASIIVHPNDHPYDSDLVEIGKDNNVENILNKPFKEDNFYSNKVNAAIYILSPEIFKYIPSNESVDFGKDVFPKIIQDKKHKIRAYNTPEYIKDLGTPDRLAKVTQDWVSGKIKDWNKKNKRPAIFIDRDGTINKEVDNLRNINQFELLPNVDEAIQKINKSNYFAIIVTNQPMVAKGFLTFKELSEIHNKLETQLGIKRAFVDAIYFCPHHPDTGFEGEVSELKIKCQCRKPECGMIKQASIDFNIDLNHSYIVGDTTIDIKTGQNAGLKTILVSTGFAGKDKNYEVFADFYAQDLLAAVNIIL